MKNIDTEKYGLSSTADDEALAMKIMDEMMCMMIVRNSTNNHLFSDGLKLLARYKKRMPDHPVTVALVDLMPKE